MKKLIFKMSVMVAMLAATAAFVVIVVPPDRGDYLAVINDKMEMIESAHGPKIVFVGGSNLAFGLDSARVEAETGYTVVNMGMGFNMGLRFMLDLVEPRIGADDVVVLVPEYNLFFGLFDGDVASGIPSRSTDQCQQLASEEGVRCAAGEGSLLGQRPFARSVWKCKVARRSDRR